MYYIPCSIRRWRKAENKIQEESAIKQEPTSDHDDDDDDDDDRGDEGVECDNEERDRSDAGKLVSGAAQW